MAGSLIERTFNILEALAREPGGVNLQALAESLRIPKSGTHRMLSEMIRLGYVRQDGTSSRYQLTSRLIAQGFRYLSASGADIVQPILDRLARTTGELVRLGVVEDGNQTWIAKAQGTSSGLRYEPEMGVDVPLFCTASGHAMLACLSDAQALELVERQGLMDFSQYGPKAPRSSAELLERLQLVRQRGYAWVVESSVPGTSALAAPVRHFRDGRVLGVVSITGPSVRLPEARLHEMAPLLLGSVAEIAEASPASEFFG